jgi:hypothetical protein
MCVIGVIRFQSMNMLNSYRTVGSALNAALFGDFLTGRMLPRRMACLNRASYMEVGLVERKDGRKVHPRRRRTRPHHSSSACLCLCLSVCLFVVQI